MKVLKLLETLFNVKSYLLVTCVTKIFFNVERRKKFVKFHSWKIKVLKLLETLFNVLRSLIFSKHV